jgi:hypothetical protein
MKVDALTVAAAVLVLAQGRIAQLMGGIESLPTTDAQMGGGCHTDSLGLPPLRGRKQCLPTLEVGNLLPRLLEDLTFNLWSKLGTLRWPLTVPYSDDWRNL